MKILSFNFILTTFLIQKMRSTISLGIAPLNGIRKSDTYTSDNTFSSPESPVDCFSRHAIKLNREPLSG